MNLRAQHAALYTPIYDKFMLGTFNEYDLVCQKVMDVITDTTSQWLSDDISGLGRWDETDEGQAGQTEDPVLGYPETFTHLKYTKTFQVSFEGVDDDEYALMKREGQAKEMGTGGRDRLEFSTAQVFITGLTTAGSDGQILFSNAHPKNREETGTTYDNLLSGAFSHDALETAETQITNNMFSMAGIPIPITGEVVLLHPPALRGPIHRVLRERALERPGTAERDINRFVGKGTTYKYTPVEWIYLSSALGGSDTAWFLIFPWLGYFKLIWRQRPHFVSWVDEKLDVYNFKGRQRYSTGNDNWRGGFASSGL